MSRYDLPSIEGLKAEAKRLRIALADTGKSISHSQSLEMLARQRGFRDWNTLHAAAGNGPSRSPYWLGQVVTGTYLGHPIRGSIHALSALGDGRYRLTIDLEEAVDVVAFESFSAYRKRLKANVTGKGRTVEKTSDGQPHMQLDL
ncbi:MAG: glyoxalase superfamily protein [Pseudomonadota bacterium]